MCHTHDESWATVHSAIVGEEQQSYSGPTLPAQPGFVLGYPGMENPPPQKKHAASFKNVTSCCSIEGELHCTGLGRHHLIILSFGVQSQFISRGLPMPSECNRPYLSVSDTTLQM